MYEDIQEFDRIIIIGVVLYYNIETDDCQFVDAQCMTQQYPSSGPKMVSVIRI